MFSMIKESFRGVRNRNKKKKNPENKTFSKNLTCIIQYFISKILNRQSFIFLISFEKNKLQLIIEVKATFKKIEFKEECCNFQHIIHRLSDKKIKKIVNANICRHG